MCQCSKFISQMAATRHLLSSVSNIRVSRALVARGRSHHLLYNVCVNIQIIHFDPMLAFTLIVFTLLTFMLTLFPLYVTQTCIKSLLFYSSYSFKNTNIFYYEILFTPIKNKPGHV